MEIPEIKKQFGRSVEELLQAANSLLDRKPEYSNVDRTLIFVSLLTDVPYLGTNIHQIYEPAFNMGGFYFNGHFTVVHGHPVGDVCVAPAFCHEITYRPKVTDNPAFIKQFYLKWPFLK